MKKVLAALLALPSVVSAEAPTRGEEGKRSQLYFFFSNRSASAPETAKAIAAFLAKPNADVILRPALLVEDWSTFKKVDETSPLYQTIRHLGRGSQFQIQIFDEEALDLAMAWRITRLPALVLVSHGRAHVLQGSAAGLEGLQGCQQ